MCKQSYRFILIMRPSIFARVHKNGRLSSRPFLCALDLCILYTVSHQSGPRPGNKAPPHTLAEEILLFVSHRQYSTIWWILCLYRCDKCEHNLVQSSVVFAQFLVLQVVLVIYHIVQYDAHPDNVEERRHSGILAGDVCCSVGMYQPTHKLRKWTKVLDNILASITDTNVSKLLRHVAPLQRTDHTNTQQKLSTVNRLVSGPYSRWGG